MGDSEKYAERVLATMAELLRGDGSERELEIVSNAQGKLEQVGYEDNFALFCLSLRVDTQVYARYREHADECEKVILEAGRAVLRTDPEMWLESVVIGPTLVENANWRGKAYKVRAKGLLRELEAERNMLISVATGGPRIESVSNAYNVRRRHIAEGLRERQIADPNPFSDLWQWYGKWSTDLRGYQSRREFVADMYRDVLARMGEESEGGEVRAFEDATGWDRVDRTVAEIRVRIAEAENAEQFQAVGLLCRDALISVAQAVYDRERHPPVDDVEPSETDAKRMLEAFLGVEVGGAFEGAARRYARSVVVLAHEVTHKRTATPRVAALCAEATISAINVIAIVAGQRDRVE